MSKSTNIAYDLTFKACVHKSLCDLINDVYNVIFVIGFDGLCEDKVPFPMSKQLSVPLCHHANATIVRKEQIRTPSEFDETNVLRGFSRYLLRKLDG